MRNPKNNGNFVRNSLFYVILALGFLGLFYWVAGPTQTTTTKTTTTSQFVTDLKDNKIKKITVRPGAGVYEITGEYRKAQCDSDSKKDQKAVLLVRLTTFCLVSKIPRLRISKRKLSAMVQSSQDIQNAADKSKTAVTTKPQASNFWGTMLVTLLPVLLMVGLFYMMMSGMQGGGQGGRGGGTGPVSQRQSLKIQAKTKCALRMLPDVKKKKKK